MNRFYVLEMAGYRIERGGTSRGGRTRSHAPRCYYIHDRADIHQVVGVYPPHGYWYSHGPQRERNQRLADTRAAELNAWDEAP